MKARRRKEKWGKRAYFLAEGGVCFPWKSYPIFLSDTCWPDVSLWLYLAAGKAG